MKITEGKLQKWSLVRTQRVDVVYGLFTKDHELIEKIDDGRDFSLVVLREDYLRMITEECKNNKLHIKNLREIISAKDELTESLKMSIEILNK